MDGLRFRTAAYSSTRCRIVAVAADKRRASGSAQLFRGVLAALVAVGSAALAHTAAGHHSPHAMVIILTLIVSIPVCVQLSGRTLSVGRLAAAVLSSQALLHGLFALLPATSAGNSGLPSGAHAHHGDPGAGAGSGAASSAFSSSVHGASPFGAGHIIAGQTDTAMIAAHLLAAVFAFSLLRRGETLLHAITERLGIAPVLILLRPQPVPAAPQRIPMRGKVSDQPLQDLWPGESPRTPRGPPMLVK